MARLASLTRLFGRNHAVQVFAETGQIFRAWFEIEGTPPPPPFPVLVGNSSAAISADIW